MSKKKIFLSDIAKVYGNNRVDLAVYSKSGTYLLISNASVNYRSSAGQLHIDAGNYFTHGCVEFRIDYKSDIEYISYDDESDTCYIKFKDIEADIWISPTEVEKYRGYPDDWIAPEEREIVGVPAQE